MIDFKWESLGDYARKVYSQCGEEGIIEQIFAVIGTTNRYLVDLGAGAIGGQPLSNTQLFLEQGWTGARFDGGDTTPGVHQAWMTQENIVEVVAARDVPKSFDLLSLDLDGNDFYILRSLLRAGYQPRVMVVEINGQLPEDPPLAIIYNPTHTFDETLYYGASLGAFRRLAANYGYTCVYVHSRLNAFFVRSALLVDPTRSMLGVHVPVRGCWPADPQKRKWRQLGAMELK